MPPSKHKKTDESLSGGRPRKAAKKKTGTDVTSKAKEDDGESSEDSDYDGAEGGTWVAGVYVPPAPPVHCSHEATASRLIISHIVVENFKSYQGKCTLGPFDKSFTAIVGPNGSGKSNTIDAMLFVFGYRATKIRSNKLAVLIHKSEKHTELRSCTVAVHFKGIKDLPGDKFEEIPGGSFVVARSAFSNNTSKYTVNGKNCSFKEVAALLQKHGIDLKHNRFLILQGEVEQIAMMKPKAQSDHDTGMLEYLEDIIGSHRFKKPIEKLSLKVEQADEERKEKLNRLKLAEKDKAALHGPLRESLAYLCKDNDKTRARNKHLQYLLWEARSENSKVEAEEEALKLSMKELQTKLKEFKQGHESNTRELNGKTKEKRILENELKKIKDKFNQAENRTVQLSEELTSTNKRRKSALDTKKREESKLSDLRKVPEKNTKEIEELNVQKEKLSKEQESQKEKIQELRESVKEATKDLFLRRDEIQNELIGVKQIHQDAKSKWNVAKTEMDLFIKNEEKESTKLKQLSENFAKQSAELEKKKREMDESEKFVKETEPKLQGNKAEAAKLQLQEENLRREYMAAKSEATEKSAASRNTESRGRVLDFLMEKKRSGELPGLLGRLGDLGGIDMKYDVAVSTACSALDNLVVDTVDTATNAVKLLKKYNVGRANFIALQKIMHLERDYRQPFRAPENVPRLFDLISVADEKVKAAFYFGLRDTLVADNLDQAKRVAYGSTRYRVVTLAGEVIEIVGTMSGGGNVQYRGRMGSKSALANAVDPKEISRLEEKALIIEKQLTPLSEKRASLEDTIARLAADLGSHRPRLNVLRTQIPHLEKQVAELSKAVKEQTVKAAAVKSDPAKLAWMEEEVSSLAKIMEEKGKEVSELEVTLKSITKEIDDASSNKISAAQKKLTTITNQLQKVSKEISKLTAEIKSSSREVTKSENKIQGFEAEIAECEEKMTKIKEEKDEITECGAKLNEKSSEIKFQLEEVEEVIVKLQADLKSSSKEEVDIKQKILALEQKVTAATGKKSEYSGQIKSCNAKLAELKLHEIPKINDEEEDLALNEDNVPDAANTSVAEGPLSLRVYPDELLEAMDKAQLKYKVTALDNQLQSMKYQPDIVKQYKAKLAVYKERIKEVEEITEKRNELRSGYEGLRNSRLVEFMNGFTIISNKLKEMYQMVTFGGDAEFELADSLDPFTEGVNFSVRPPRKSWKIISNLSGGEKTLASLALVFALHYYKPSPLYFMDEIDAALDFRNVSIVGHYIKERTKNSQFVVISLRNNMFELADVLVGVYKTFNCSKSVTITPSLYAAEDPTQTSNN